MFIPLMLGAALGAYSMPHRTIYVGPEEYNGHSYSEYYDTSTRRFGKLDAKIGFSLKKPSVEVLEDRLSASDSQGPIGFSLWHTKGARQKPTIVLIHGADQETRDMGWTIPFFVAHGMNVITFDQRGTGSSAGNWQATGPEQKAEDVVAMLRSVDTNPAVDKKRIGAWGPSNGGWVAPIVANDYPLAFIILKSAPAESIESNVAYEVEQALREHGTFNEQQIAAAMKFEQTMFASLRTNSNWPQAQAAVDAAQHEPWYPLMRMPPGMTFPPPAPLLNALQASLEYDPTAVLEKVHVPTLAVFGALDKNVDAADSARLFRTYFQQAGLRDFTTHTFPNADHILEVSKTGYLDDDVLPDRLVPGYPEIMIDWLTARGFATK